MPVTFYSEAELVDLTLAFFRVRFPAAALDEAGYFGQLARSLAASLSAVVHAVSAADTDSVPGKLVDGDGNVVARNTTLSLDAWARDLGLPSNRTAGAFGRNEAQPASGGAGLVSNPSGAAITVPAGAQLLDPTGLVTVQLTAAITIPAANAVSGGFVALTPGALGNLPVATVLRWQSPPPGLAPTVTLTSPLTDGFDRETDLALVDRVIAELQAARSGGTAADWRRWAEEATDATGKLIGIKRAYVYPHRNGLGSVDVIVTQAGTGAGRAPSAAKLAEVLAYLKGKKIVTDAVRVQAPAFPGTSHFRLTTFVRPHPNYEFDYLDSAVAIVSYAGLALVIPLSEPPPSLKAAIDAGRQPRVQVTVPTQVLPFEVRVGAYAVDTPMAGQCTLTLTGPLPAAPSLPTLWAGGPAVQLVAAAALAYIDQVGPSRKSGYASQTDVWEDRVSISGIAQVIRAKRGPDGNQVIVYAPDAGVALGITTDAFGGADVLLGDIWLPSTNGPECPQCRSVIVARS